MKIPKELAFLGALAFELLFFVLGSAVLGQYLVKNYGLNPMITPGLVFFSLGIVIYRIYMWNKKNNLDG